MQLSLNELLEGVELPGGWTSLDQVFDGYVCTHFIAFV